jgi:uncharacterized membrane protein
MSVESALALATLLIGVPLNLYVTLRLWRLSREQPHIKVLRERAIVAALVLLLVIVFGLVFVNNDLSIPFLQSAVTKYVTRIAMLVVAIVPAAYWLILYRDTP